VTGNHINYDGSLGNGDLPLKMALASRERARGPSAATVGIQTGAQDGPTLWHQGADAPYLPSALGAQKYRWIRWYLHTRPSNKGIRVEPPT